MDTDWYAVDADGNIAVFNTDDVGALPSGVPYGECGLSHSESEIVTWELGGFDRQAVAAEALAQAHQFVFIDDIMAQPQVPFKELYMVKSEPTARRWLRKVLRHPAPEDGIFYGLLLIADDIDVSQPPWNTEQLFRTRFGRLVYAQTNGIPESDVLSLAVSRGILRAWHKDIFYYEPWRLGFFQYSLQYNEAGRRRDLSITKYFRDATPKDSPLMLESLPVEVQKQFEHSRINLRFSDAECIDVQLHFSKLATWGDQNQCEILK
jgi:hypothetical protein